MNLLPGQAESWLAEDIGTGDITTGALIPQSTSAYAGIHAKEEGVVCGLRLIEPLLAVLGATGQVEYHFSEGAKVRRGDLLAGIRADHAALLKAERSYLNILQHLSGIATQTRRYVDKVAHTRAKILDTRKTTPGLRLLEKAAVAAGGGHNHRIGLYDQFLVKENHLAAWRTEANPFVVAISKARSYRPGVPVIIEVQSLAEAQLALQGRPEVILLDNMDYNEMRACVAARAGLPVELEASGGITLDNVGEVAETGVDRISIGALTHSAKNLDISMLVEIEKLKDLSH